MGWFESATSVVCTIWPQRSGAAQLSLTSVVRLRRATTCRNQTWMARHQYCTAAESVTLSAWPAARRHQHRATITTSKRAAPQQRRRATISRHQNTCIAAGGLSYAMTFRRQATGRRVGSCTLTTSWWRRASPQTRLTWQQRCVPGEMMAIVGTHTIRAASS